MVNQISNKQVKRQIVFSGDFGLKPELKHKHALFEVSLRWTGEWLKLDDIVCLQLLGDPLVIP